ncbi:MAG: signal peptide peptidase SppA [Thermaurantiacus sp.]
MPFLKTVWKIIVGVKDFLVLVLLVILFGGLWASLSMRPAAVKVPDGAALVIALDGVLVDQATRPRPVDLLANQSPVSETQARDVIKALDRAAEDRRIGLVILDLDLFLGGGRANLEAVGDAITRVRAAGKEVRAFAVAYTDPGYYLAAHANEIWLDPLGAVAVTGPGGPGLYFAEALEKLGISVEVFRVGTFKSAVEPLTRNNQSPEAREAEQALADSLWTSYRSRVEGLRTGLDLVAFTETYGARAAGANIGLSQIALDSGLVDRLGSRLMFEKAVRETVGAGDEEDRPGDFKRISLSDYIKSDRSRERGPGVGVVHIAGTIIDGDAPAGTAGAESIVKLIDEATADKDVKALVLRIDSPGGSVTASERIREAALAARERGLPVVASFGPLAASGGYWVGAAADTIIAHPSTITGSIGIFGVIPIFDGTLDKLGVGADGVTTTPLTGQPDLLRGLNEPTRNIFQASVVDGYRRFIGLVAEARKMPVADVEAIAEGRVWSGSQALERGLIDRFGSLDDAVAEAGQRAGLDEKPRVIFVEPSLSPFETLLLELVGSSPQEPAARAPDLVSRLVRASRAAAMAELEAAIAVGSGPAIQAHCLSCAGHAPARGTAARGRFADWIQRILG